MTALQISILASLHLLHLIKLLPDLWLSYGLCRMAQKGDLWRQQRKILKEQTQRKCERLESIITSGALRDSVVTSRSEQTKGK